MANPTRLTRVVPASSSCAGSTVDGVRVVTKNTGRVRCVEYMLHHDPEGIPRAVCLYAWTVAAE